MHQERQEKQQELTKALRPQIFILAAVIGITIVGIGMNILIRSTKGNTSFQDLNHTPTPTPVEKSINSFKNSFNSDIQLTPTPKP